MLVIINILGKNLILFFNTLFIGVYAQLHVLVYLLFWYSRVSRSILYVRESAEDMDIKVICIVLLFIAQLQHIKKASNLAGFLLNTPAESYQMKPNPVKTFMIFVVIVL